MKSRSALALAVLSIALTAAPAQAQTGGGLYEPFPTPAPESQVKRYIARLPGSSARSAEQTSDRDLREGKFLGRSLPASAGAGQATSRAESGADVAGALAGLAVIALVIGSALAITRRHTWA